MKSVHLSLIAAGLLTSVAGFSQSGIRVAKDQKFTVETSTKFNSSAEVMGQTMETTSDIKTTTLYEVTGVSSDGIGLRSSITKMTLTGSSMGQEMSFDSEDKNSSGPVADMLKPKINKANNLQLDNNGKIVKQDETGDNSQMLMMGMSSGNGAVTELFIPELSGKTLKAGDQVPVITNLKKDKYSSRDSGTYVVSAVENGIASLSYTGVQTINATIEQMGMEMETNSNNVVKSELQVDVATGLVLMKATVVDQNISVDAGGMTIPASGKIIVTTKITPVQ